MKPFISILNVKEKIKRLNEFIITQKIHYYTEIAIFR